MEVKESSSSVDPEVAPGEPAATSPARSPRRRHRQMRARRGLADRITVSTVIGLVAALLVFVLVAVLLRDRREMVTVAVASERIPAGTTITPAMVHRAELPASTSFVGGLVRFDDMGTSSVAARTVQPGEVLSRSALGSRQSSSGARVMAIPVESWQAVGGELDVGDQVDVIDTGEAGPRYVLSGAAVVARATDSSGGGLVSSSSSGKLWIDVEVTAAEALELAAVIDAGDFVLVRSTGAGDEPAAAPTTAPVAATASSSPAVSVPTSGGG
jgi:Flp pilus assembly protein CpaB